MRLRERPAGGLCQDQRVRWCSARACRPRSSRVPGGTCCPNHCNMRVGTPNDPTSAGKDGTTRACTFQPGLGLEGGEQREGPCQRLERVRSRAKEATAGDDSARNVSVGMEVDADSGSLPIPGSAGNIAPHGLRQRHSWLLVAPPTSPLPALGARCCWTIGKDEWGTV